MPIDSDLASVLETLASNLKIAASDLLDNVMALPIGSTAPAPPVTPPANTGAAVPDGYKLKRLELFQTFPFSWLMDNRWEGNTPQDWTDEGTNNPSSQDDSSISTNARIGPNGLELWVTPQQDPKNSKPFNGAHVGGRSKEIFPGDIVEWDLAFNYTGNDYTGKGGTWIGAPVYYGLAPETGEIDGAEIQNTRTQKRPTANAHRFATNPDGSVWQTGQDQTDYLVDSSITNYVDGVTRTYRTIFHPDGKTISFELNGVPCANDKIVVPSLSGWVPWLELGVPSGEKPNAGAAIICSRYQQWTPA